MQSCAIFTLQANKGECILTQSREGTHPKKTAQKTNPSCQRKQLQTDMKIMVRRGIPRAVVTM